MLWGRWQKKNQRDIWLRITWISNQRIIPHVSIHKCKSDYVTHVYSRHNYEPPAVCMSVCASEREYSREQETWVQHAHSYDDQPRTMLSEWDQPRHYAKPPTNHAYGGLGVMMGGGGLRERHMRLQCLLDVLRLCHEVEIMCQPCVICRPCHRSNSFK